MNSRSVKLFNGVIIENVDAYCLYFKFLQGQVATHCRNCSQKLKKPEEIQVSEW